MQIHYLSGCPHWAGGWNICPASRREHLPHRNTLAGGMLLLLPKVNECLFDTSILKHVFFNIQIQLYHDNLDKPVARNVSEKWRYWIVEYEVHPKPPKTLSKLGRFRIMIVWDIEMYMNDKNECFSGWTAVILFSNVNQILCRHFDAVIIIWYYTNA